VAAASGLTCANSANFSVAVLVSANIAFWASNVAATTARTVFGFFAMKSVRACSPLRPHWSFAVERSKVRLRPSAVSAAFWLMPTTPQPTDPPLSAAIRSIRNVRTSPRLWQNPTTYHSPAWCTMPYGSIGRRSAWARDAAA